MTLAAQIEWRNGVPTVVGREVHTRTSLSAFAAAAVSLPFAPTEEWLSDHPDEARYIGLTMGEVMIIKQAERAAQGDHEATVNLMDRICGKPKQQIENTNLNMSFKDYLNQIPAPSQHMIAEHNAEAEALININLEDAGEARRMEVKLLGGQFYRHLAEDL